MIFKSQSRIDQCIKEQLRQEIEELRRQQGQGRDLVQRMREKLDRQDRELDRMTHRNVNLQNRLNKMEALCEGYRVVLKDIGGVA